MLAPSCCSCSIFLYSGALFGFPVRIGLSPSSISTRFDFPGLLSHSLLVYALRTIPTHSCLITKEFSTRCPPDSQELFPPLVKHTTSPYPASPHDTTHEVSFHPIQMNYPTNPYLRTYSPPNVTYTSSALPIYLQSHSRASPFLPPQTKSGSTGLSLEIYLDPTVLRPHSLTCPRLELLEMRIELDIKASAWKMVLRYRSTLVAWSLGIIGWLMASQVRYFRKEGKCRFALSLS